MCTQAVAVYGPCTRRPPCTRPAHGREHDHVHGAYTAVNSACVHGSVYTTRPCTRAVSTDGNGHGPCTRPCGVHTAVCTPHLNHTIIINYCFVTLLCVSIYILCIEIETSIIYKYNLNHIVFGSINAIVNKLLESKWRPSSSRDSDSQSQVRHGLRQLFFIYGFGHGHP